MSPPVAMAPARSLPRLRRQTGLMSRLLSRGWGLEDMGMPYRKLESTELLAVMEEEEEEEGGLEDVEGPWGGWGLAALPWAPGDSLAGEGLWLRSAAGLDSRGESADGLWKYRKNIEQEHIQPYCGFILVSLKWSSLVLYESCPCME